jgi:hypothetical protein
MPKPRLRTCLEQGLKLDINELRRRGFVRPEVTSGLISWKHTHNDEDIAMGGIIASIGREYEGWLRIQIGNLDQIIALVPRPRHFGGYQWYFLCPLIKRRASVLWLLPGGGLFRSRQAWGRVAYASQFLNPDNRAHIGKAKIKSRLIADLDPDEWDLPPKPKWMRWHTYNRYVVRYDAYEAILDYRLAERVAKRFPKWFP